MDDLRVPIPCMRCGHAETEVVTARVVFGPDEMGRRVHRQTSYMLRCPNSECGHVFSTDEKLADREHE
jgi:hypothetical protein